MVLEKELIPAESAEKRKPVELPFLALYVSEKRKNLYVCVYATKSQQHLGPKCQIVREGGIGKKLNCEYIQHLFANFSKVSYFID